MNIYAFADEASPLISGQIAALQRNNLQGLEIRGVDGQSISDISLKKAREVRQQLDDAGLTVWSIGSPIGKISIEDTQFPAHLDKLRHTLSLSVTLGAENLRMFSFYMPGNPEAWRQKVIDQVGEMLRVAEGSGVTLCHENEKGIYGDTAARCLDLLTTLPQLKGVFDPANFIQCGQDTPAAWNLLARHTKYLHIKDAQADGHVVPAGKGVGHLPEILDDFRSLGGQCLTIEPHLTVFQGFQSLERPGEETKMAYTYPSSDAAFDVACAALWECL